MQPSRLRARLICPLPGGGGEKKNKCKIKIILGVFIFYFCFFAPPPPCRTLFLRAPTILKRPPSRGRVAQSMFRFLGVDGTILACTKPQNVASRSYMCAYIHVCICSYIYMHACTHKHLLLICLCVTHTRLESMYLLYVRLRVST